MKKCKKDVCAIEIFFEEIYPYVYFLDKTRLRTVP